MRPNFEVKPKAVAHLALVQDHPVVNNIVCFYIWPQLLYSIGE